MYTGFIVEVGEVIATTSGRLSVRAPKAAGQVVAGGLGIVVGPVLVMGVVVSGSHAAYLTSVIIPACIW